MFTARVHGRRYTLPVFTGREHTGSVNRPLVLLEARTLDRHGVSQRSTADAMKTNAVARYRRRWNPWNPDTLAAGR